MAKPVPIKQSLPGLWRLLGFLRPYLEGQGALLVGSFAALLLGVAARALEPWPLTVVIDYVIMPGENGTLGPLPRLQEIEPMTIVAGASLALVLILGLRAAGNYFQKVGFALVGNRALTRVRGDLFEHIHCLSLSFHNRSRSGDMLVRVIGDVGQLREVAVTALMPLIGSVLVLLVMSALMLWLNWRLALVVLATLPLYWLPTLFFGRKIRQVSRKQKKREGAMASTASETIGAMQMVQTLALEDTFVDQFAGQNQKSLKEGVKARRLLARLQGTVQVTTGVSTALVLAAGTWFVLAGELSAGELLVFLSYLKAAFRPMQDFAKYSGRLAKASASGERVMELFAIEPDVADRPGAVEAPRFDGVIRFDGVGFAYEPGHAVLENLEFSVAAGERVALVGPSGAGKSSVIRLLSRLYDPTNGAIRFDGTDLRDVTLASLRDQVAVVLQETTLFAASVRDNIAYGGHDPSDDEIRTAAEQANAHGFIEALPDGYDTVLGERGVTLSAGQRQRIAIARAAVSNAPILLLDEPTSGLDDANSKLVVDALHTLFGGRTTLLVTHQPQAAASADRVIYLENGHVVESGTHDELMARGGRYADMAWTIASSDENP